VGDRQIIRGNLDRPLKEKKPWVTPFVAGQSIERLLHPVGRTQSNCWGDITKGTKENLEEKKTTQGRK